MIGTDLTGTVAIGNAASGIGFFSAAASAVIGGSSASERNVISGNGGDGIELGSGSDGSTIDGNYIGVDANGVTALANSGNGISLTSDNTTIGGTGSGDGNVISGNSSDGILLDSGATGNVVQGNLIGVGSDGTTSVPNGSNGIEFSSSSDNDIGGTAANSGNTIANNTGNGILFDSGTGNAVLGNSIHSNGGLGIDLNANGTVETNDALDSDGGDNNGQNYPVITVTGLGSTIIQGTFGSAASTTYRLEFFANDSEDSPGISQGQVFLGSDDVTTDGSGDATFNVTLTETSNDGQFITATATDPSNNTSEFSASLVVNGLGEPVLTTFGGSTFPGSKPVFMWGSVTSAVSYTLQYDTDVDFGSPTEVTGITGLDHTAASALAGATFYWRVRAVGAGTAGGYSASDSFVIIPTLEEWLVILLAMGMLGYGMRRLKIAD